MHAAILLVDPESIGIRVSHSTTDDPKDNVALRAVNLNMRSK